MSREDTPERGLADASQIMTFVPRNLHWQGEYLSEWGPRGKKFVKRKTNRVARRAARFDLRHRSW